MKTSLTMVFLAIFAGMSYATITATLDRGLFEAGRELWPDLWFRATLLDAYFGFLTFYLWVAYKETRWFARAIWFVLIMTLGNFAMSAYILWQLTKMREFSIENLLLRRRQAPRTA